MTELQKLQQQAQQHFRRTWSGLPLDTALWSEKIEDVLKEAVASAYHAGQERAVEYIKTEAGIDADMSPVNDYVIPFQVLEAARNAE